MNKTKVSIDLWGTLIRGSQSFKDKKYKLIQKYFPAWERKEIEERFLNVKSDADSKVEATGWQPKINHLWNAFFTGYYAGIDYNVDIIVESLKPSYAKLAIENPPTLWDNDTTKILSQLYERYQLVLSSNTLFLEGKTLRVILDNLDISRFFDKMNFSDELGVAKPNKLMYDNSKYHIGDNLITDCQGADTCGIKFFQVNSNDKTLEDALNYINQEEGL